MITNGFIQVAGVIDKKEADMLVSCGVKFLGFPLRLPVNKEDLSEQDAKKIITTLPEGVEAILITYMNEAREISELANYLGVKYIQLHGAIAVEELEKLKQDNPHYILIKSLVIGEGSFDQLMQTMKSCMSYVDAFITDTFDPKTGASGATGKTHDWSVTKELIDQSPKPIILAGGLTPDNVNEAIQNIQPIGVDAHTGLEGSDGRKDSAMVQSFITQASAALDRKTIYCSGALTAGKFSKLTQKAYKGTDGHVSELVIDLRDIEFIEMPTLIYILSVLCQRTDDQLYTLIRIPKEKKIRDYLRLWNFPKSVAECTGKGFSSFCNQEDIEQYFGENKVEDDFRYFESKSENRTQFINEKCFSICTHKLTSNIDKTADTILVSSIANKWKDPLVRNHLNNFFKPEKESKEIKSLQPNYISSRIVYEAISNALRHPNAKILISSSSLSYTHNKTKALLTLTYWDDGITFYSTISRALQTGKNIYCDVHQDDCFSYIVKHLNPLGDVRRFPFESDRKISIKSPVLELFLACLSPGVSCDIDRENYLEPSDDLAATPPGWGLYALLNCACEVFAGSVVIQSGCLFANVCADAANSEHKFKVTLRESEPGSPCFNGNMITVRLPLG